MARAPENLWSSVLEAEGVFYRKLLWTVICKERLEDVAIFRCDVIWDVSISLVNSFY